LEFLYENNPKFSVIPTYPAALIMKGDNKDVFPFAPSAGIPGLKFNPAMLLQYLFHFIFNFFISLFYFTKPVESNQWKF
jgi:hypothetical protein